MEYRKHTSLDVIRWSAKIKPPKQCNYNTWNNIALFITLKQHWLADLTCYDFTAEQPHKHILLLTLHQPQLLSGSQQLDLFPGSFSPPDHYDDNSSFNVHTFLQRTTYNMLFNVISYNNPAVTSTIYCENKHKRTGSVRNSCNSWPLYACSADQRACFG